VHDISDIYKILAQLYPSIGESRRVVASAGFESSRIAFETQAITNWFNIVSESENQRKTSALLKVALEEFPGRSDDINDLLNKLERVSSQVGLGDDVSVAIEDSTTLSYENLSNEDLVQNTKVRELDLVFKLKDYVRQITECNVIDAPNEAENLLTTLIVESDAQSLSQVQKKLYAGVNVIASIGENPNKLDCTIPGFLSSTAEVGSETSQLFRILLLGATDKNSTETEYASPSNIDASNDALIRSSSIANVVFDKENSKSQGMTTDRDHYVIIIHGIRTQAEYQTKLASEIEANPNFKAITLGYEYLDVLRFLTWGRGKPVEAVARKIRDCGLMSPKPQKLSIIAHSFGTYIVSKILEKHTDIVFDKVIFCGSIVPATFKWDRYPHRFDTPLLNDCGMFDIWPVFAKFATWGYGPSGRFGFKSNRVRDRFHRFRHSDFFTGDFYNRYWKPFLEDGVIDEGELDRETTPWWISILA